MVICKKGRENKRKGHNLKEVISEDDKLLHPQIDKVYVGGEEI